MKNDGKSSEKQFEDYFKKYGKSAYVYRFPDARDSYGINQKKMVKTFARPSDYLVVNRGQTFFAEVKSVSTGKSFSFSSLQPSQIAAAKQTHAAGGQYYFVVHALHLSKWFIFTAEDLIQARKNKLKSIKFDHMTEVDIANDIH